MRAHHHDAQQTVAATAGSAFALFSGVGGLDLGTEAAGFSTLAFVEWDADAADSMDGEIATTRDLRVEVGGSRSEMQAGFAEMHAGFAEVRATHSGLLVKLFSGMVASNATLVGLVLAATRLG